MVLDQPSPDPRNFVRTDRGADSAPADRHAALHFPTNDSLRERDDEVGIIVTGIQAVRPYIDYLMSRLPKACHHFFLQAKPTVISCDSYAHVMLPFCIQRPAFLLPRCPQPRELVRGEPGLPESTHRQP